MGVVSCPQCQRRLKIGDEHLGKKLKCPACGGVLVLEFAAQVAEPVEGARDRSQAVPRKALARPRFRLKVKHDPARVLKGACLGELGPHGLSLHKGKNPVIEVPHPATSHELGGNQFWVTIGNRDVTFAVVSANLYRQRFTRALVAALNAGKAIDDLATYSIPRFAQIISLLPAIGVFLLLPVGGAIGGALFGAIGGLFAIGCLAIFRQDQWPMTVRTAGALVLGLLSNALFVAVFVAVTKTAGGKAPPAVSSSQPVRPASPVEAAPAIALAPARATAPEAGSPPGPAAIPGPQPVALAPLRSAVFSRPLGSLGSAEDPDGDCTFTIQDRAVTIQVPGTMHDLLLAAGRRTNAPRIMTKVEGDFVAELKVVPYDPPADPPAPSSQVAFHGAGLLAWGEDGTFVRLERAAFVRGGLVRHYILFSAQTQGTPGLEHEHDCVPELSYFLRLERRGNQLVGSFSTDRIRWDRLWTAPFLSPRLKVGVDAVNTSSRALKARFEDFSLMGP